MATLDTWGSSDNHLSHNLLRRQSDFEEAGKYSSEGLLMTTSVLNRHILTTASIPVTGVKRSLKKAEIQLCSILQWI